MDTRLRSLSSADGLVAGKPCFPTLQASFVGTFSAEKIKMKIYLKNLPRRAPLLGRIKCEKEDNPFEEVSVEHYPYYSYMDSTSRQLEPASGARANIPGEDYWPEGTTSQVRAARAPEPTGKSTGAPSFGKTPGSRRKKYRTAVAASESSASSAEPSDSVALESSNDTAEELNDFNSEYVSYNTETESEELTQYELDKRLGAPHPFIDPKVRKTIEEPLTTEELWWNWRKPETDQWSRWQRRQPDVQTGIENLGYHDDKPKRKDPLSLEEAINDSENLTDFLMDFDEEQ